MLRAVFCTSSGLPRPFILSSHTGLSICILLLTLVELCFGRTWEENQLLLLQSTEYHFSCQFQLLIYFASESRHHGFE
jgi:hypothetical protein